MSHASELRSHSGRFFLPKALPEDRVEKTTNPKDQALMLVREFIAAKICGVLLGAPIVGKGEVQKLASPEYLFFDDSRLYSEFVRDAKGLDQSIEADIFTLPQIRTLIAENAALIAKIVAASYLVCETDFNTDNLLVLPSEDERFCRFVRIDYDHSLLHPGFFPCDIRLEGDETLVQHLFNINPGVHEMDAGFLNWLPASGSFKAGFKRIIEGRLELANEAAMSVFEAFGQFKESDFRDLVSVLPASLREVAGLGEIEAIIDLLVLRSRQVNEFLGCSTPASDLSTSIESLGGRGGVHHVATTLSFGDLSTPLALAGDSAPTGKPRSPDLQLSMLLESSPEA